MHTCVKKDDIRIVGGPSDCKASEKHIALAKGEAPAVLAANMSEALLELQAELDALKTRNDELEALLRHFSRDGDDVYITGANLHVVNGTSTTYGDPNSLGNIIIDYNELRPEPHVNDRTGSHMLLVGSELNYSKFGGIVVGLRNTASGDYSSVSGGIDNEAIGHQSSVCGGQSNEAIGQWSSAGGGFDQEALLDHEFLPQRTAPQYALAGQVAVTIRRRVGTH